MPPPFLASRVAIGERAFPAYSLFVIVVAVVVALGMFALLQFTLFGWRVRAAVEDPELLASTGTDVNRLSTTLFAIGAGLAGLAGGVVAPLQAVTSGMDASILVAAFIVAILGELATKLAAQRARLGHLNAITTHYAALQEQREHLAAQLNAYRKQVEQLRVHQAMNDRDFASVTQLSPAMQPNRPSAPRKPLILGLAAAFAVIAAAAYVIIAEFFDCSFSTDRDVARVLGLPVMASVPEARKV